MTATSTKRLMCRLLSASIPSIQVYGNNRVIPVDCRVTRPSLGVTLDRIIVHTLAFIF